MKIQHRLVTFGLASALAIATAVSASAGPLPTGIASVKSATSDHVTDIRWRGRGGGFRPGIGLGIGAGIFAGALLGSAVAARPYGYGGYGYYDAPVYAEPYAYEQPYAYEPVYPAPSYGAYGYSNRGCTTDDGYGRRLPCDGR